MNQSLTTESTLALSPARRYLRLWRLVPKEVAYLLIAFPIAITGFAVTISLFSSGLGTIVTFFVGVVLVIAALYVSRGFGTVTLSLLQWTGRPPIEKPEWQDQRARTGFLGWLRAVLGNGHYWLYLLHTMVIDFIVATVSWSIMITWVSVALGGLTGWFWQIFLPRDESDGFVSRWFAQLYGWPEPNGPLVDGVLFFVLGVIFAATLPFVTRGLTIIHWLVARGVLSAWKSDALQREIMALNASRGAAQSAEGHSLRRLERDIHDGPQQRLVRLQMDLAAAARQLDTDPAKARGLLAEAMEQSKEALDELRALSRGFAPPILLDRGLIAALESQAVRATVPTRVVNKLAKGIELAQETERNAYFVASEALVNAITHSGATDIEVRVSARKSWLDVVVTDNGVGGATTIADHGIAGLEERLRGLGGTLEISSPAGGPTVVSAHLPISSPGS